MFDAILNTNTVMPALTPGIVVLNFILAFVLSFVIALVYKSTHKGLSYSQTFVMTLIITSVVIAAVMMIIGSNIAIAFGAFGAFSLIRFRTAIKDTKDMGYIFLVLATGMAVGTNNYIIAIVLTAVVLVIIYVLTKINFGSIRKFDYILSFNFDSQKNEENEYKQIFDKYLKSNNLLNIKSIQGGRMLQLSFSVKFIDEHETREFISSLERLGDITDVNLITAKNDIEY